MIRMWLNMETEWSTGARLDPTALWEKKVGVDVSALAGINRVEEGRKV